MEYLVTMTTLVPDGTAQAAVDEVRAREAAHSRDLAAEGHLWMAADPGELQALLKSLPLAPYLTVGTTPLTPHPTDPAAAEAAS